MLRRPSLWFSFLVFFLACARKVSGDADFESVRSKMTKDSSGKRGDPKAKYWRELVLVRFRCRMLISLMTGI